MCRLAAYLGPETSLTQLVFESDHSLEKQAWQPRELREAVLNADGFGLGWYNTADNAAAQCARYRQVIPIWNDPNLKDFLSSLQRPLWLIYIRSATPGLGTSLENTQPFQFNSWQFLHNGYINGFQQNIRPKIRALLHHEVEAIIHGTTDSEYLFALIIHFYKSSGDMMKAVRQSFDQLKSWLGDERALLNIILSDGEQIIATSHAINGLCPSLYLAHEPKNFPRHSQLLVSEPPDSDTSWKAVEPHTLLRLRPGKQPETEKL